MSKVDNAKLKDSILRGVYDDNLRMADDLSTANSLVQHRKRKPMLLLLSSFLLIGFIVLAGFGVIQFTRGHKKSIELSTEKMVMLETAPSSLEKSALFNIGPEPEKKNASFHFARASFFDNYIMRSTDAPSTEINTERLLDYSLLLNSRQVRLSSIFGLDVQTIVIDPGHGGKDPGAIGVLGTQEKNIVLDIARRLRDQLQQSGRYHVLLTRNNDKTMSLAERVKFTNAVNADLFISLHVNSLPQKRVNVTETYYYGPPSDPETLRLAEQENRGSRILTDDFNNMIKKIGDTLKEQESATLASMIQNSLFNNVKKYDKDIADAGIKIAPFVVLLGVDAPSVLVEISCITKKQEEVKLNLPSYREKITSFIHEGIARYLSQRHIQVVKGDENDKKNNNKNS